TIYLETIEIYHRFLELLWSIVTSILWLYYSNQPPVQLISASNLLLDLRLMLFLRVFKKFGAYFAIIIGVAKKVFCQNFALGYPDFNNDTNNPWNLVNAYYTYFANNNSYSQDPFLVQLPDDNTNMFAQFSSSILAMYNFLAGGNGAFGAWVLQDDSYLTVLVVAFSFIVVVYLMNLFIGLLSNEIQHYNTNEAFLAQKAKIITEIELFYLFPNQRHWINWFPDILYYDAPIDDIRKKIKAADDSNEDKEDLPYISDRLRELAELTKKTENNFDSRFQQIEDKLEGNLKEMKNDFDSKFQQIENKLEGNLKEMKNDFDSKFQQIENILEEILKANRKNLKDDLNEIGKSQ
ncbi:5695_t:CDS:2, partial [Entrophospora sp. SA101]